MANNRCCHHGRPTTALDCLTTRAHQPQPGTRGGRAGDTGGNPTPTTPTKINNPTKTSHNQRTVDRAEALLAKTALPAGALERRRSARTRVNCFKSVRRGWQPPTT